MGLDGKDLPVIIAATVSLVGVIVSVIATLVTTHWQLRSKIEELTQGQFNAILNKRIEVYPHLWRIPQTLLSDWEREKKPINSEWARELLTKLMKWHAENGVFLSQKSYEVFDALRSDALKLVEKCNTGYEPTLADLQHLDKVYYNGGLATWLKNDLGSYKHPFLTIAPA